MQHQLQKKSIDRHAHVQEMRMSPWFDQNPSTSHLRKNCTRQLTNKQKSNCNKNKAHCTKHSKFVCVSFVCSVSFKNEIPHDGIPHSCNMTASNKQLKCANHQLHALKPHFHLFLSRIPILPETLLTTSGNLITQKWVTGISTLQRPLISA